MTEQACTDSAADRAELDEAFLRWLEARVASSGPDASEDALNYLVATALHAGRPRHRERSRAMSLATRAGHTP